MQQRSRPTRLSPSDQGVFNVVSGGAIAYRALPRRGRWMRAIRRYWLPYALVAPTIVCLSGLLLYPLGVIAVESLYSVEPLIRVGWSFVGIGNYQHVLHDASFWASLTTTAIWTVVSVAMQFVLGLAAALLLRVTFRGRGLLRLVLLVPWATPAIVGALAWKWMYQGQFGLINAFLRLIGFAQAATPWLGDPHTALGAVIVANIWRGFPFIMIILLAGLVSIPDALYEAAAVDGASYWQRLRFVTLPQLRPVILVSTLLSAIWTFNNFSTIYILTGGGPAGKTDTLVTFVYENGFQFFHFGYSAALSVVLFLLVLAASIAYIRLLGSEAVQ